MTRRAYAIIVASFFTVSIAFAIRYGYGILLPEMLPALNLSKTEAGAIFASYFVTYTLASPILGMLTDRYDYRALLTGFTALLACGALLMASASSLWQGCFFFAVAGLGHAACWAPVAALVQKWVPDHRRGAALSVVNMGLGLGIPLWSTLLPLIVAAADWRAGWVAMGLFGLGVAAINFTLVRSPVNTGTAKDGAIHGGALMGGAYRKILADRGFWIIGTAYLFVGFNVLVPFAFLPIYAKESLGLPYTTATRFVATIALFGILGQLTLGTLSDAVGRIRVMMLCGLIMGLACLAMLLSRSSWALYVASGCYGLGYGAVWPTYGAAASDFFCKHHTGGIVGLWTVFLGVGSLVSPLVCGWSIDATRHYSWALLLGMISGLMSAILLLAILRRRQSP
jgi:MFS family permease